MVSFQSVGVGATAFLASALRSLEKYYHFAGDHSEKHNVDDMWGPAAHVITSVSAVSGTSRGLERLTGSAKQTKHLLPAYNTGALMVDDALSINKSKDQYKEPLQ